MSERQNIPYSPDLCNIAGVYQINVGPFFYIGSARRIGTRNSFHKISLERGDHPNHQLQAAWDKYRSFEFTLIQECSPKAHDPRDDGSMRARFLEHQAIQKAIHDPFCCNLSASAYHNTNIGEVLKAKWQDPAFRTAQIERMKARRGDAVSAESRAKMAAAKSGANNPRATPVEITLNGETHTFPAASNAADFLKVPQQVFDLWIRNKVAWPGAGKRQPKPKYRHLIGLRGKFLAHGS